MSLSIAPKHSWSEIYFISSLRLVLLFGVEVSAGMVAWKRLKFGAETTGNRHGQHIFVWSP